MSAARTWVNAHPGPVVVAFLVISGVLATEIVNAALTAGLQR